ncbi:MAG TPA: ATP-binding cassette domain-containing protein [Limnochorda sp.]
MIEARGLSHTYRPGDPPALDGIDLILQAGEAAALMGETGAGKSTLAQILAGLLRPTRGQVLWEGRWGLESPSGPAPGRPLVGYLFQRPEHQLFEATVWEDVAFGPRRLGLSPEAVAARVHEALTLVGLDPEAMRRRSPLTLSGGEQRLAALAGLLALRPRFLILDEPAAGLDAAGTSRLRDLLARLHGAGVGLLVITHSLEDAARWAHRLLVLHQGRLVCDQPMSQALQDPDELARWGVRPPVTVELARRLRAGGLPLSPGVWDLEDLASEMARLFAPGGAGGPEAPGAG